jgi:hypothetical protein
MFMNFFHSVLQIQKTRTTPYHPQSAGMVERNNRTILTMLSAFVNEHQNDWDEDPYESHMESQI